MKINKKFKFLSLVLVFIFCLTGLVSGIVESISTINTSAFVLAETFTEINNYEDLKNIADNVNNNIEDYYGQIIKLCADITIEDDFDGIGNSADKPFKGKFMGNGYNIYNLNTSLFGYTNGAEIDDVCVQSSNDNSKGVGINQAQANGYLGAIVGYAKQTTITKCFNKATITYSDNTASTVYVGGIVGRADECTISLCENYASVSNSKEVSTAYVGGIVGYAENKSSVQNCYVFGHLEVINIEANAKKADVSNTKFKISARYGPLSTKVYEWEEKTITEYEKKLEKYKVEYEEIRYEKGIGGFFKRLWNKIKQVVVTVVKWVTKEVIVPVAKKVSEIVERTVRISQEIISYKDCEKKVTEKPAYAYGIGYLTNNSTIKNVYTAKVSTAGGYSANSEYNLYLQFKANNQLTGFFELKGANIDKKLSLENSDLHGPISNKVGTNCYYFESADYSNDRKIMHENINLLNNPEPVTTYHDVKVNLIDQIMSFQGTSKSLQLKVGETLSKGLVNAYTFNFEKEFKNFNGTSCKNSLSTLTGKDMFKSTSTVWGVDSKINNGFPYLLHRYWQSA